MNQWTSQKSKKKYTKKHSFMDGMKNANENDKQNRQNSKIMRRKFVEMVIITCSFDFDIL